MDYTQVTENLADRIVDGFKTAEDASTPMASTFGDVTAPVRERIQSLSFVESLPTPKEIVTANAALVERLVSAQRDFVLKMLEQVSPEPEAKAKTATKAETDVEAKSAPKAKKAAAS